LSGLDPKDYIECLEDDFIISVSINYSRSACPYADSFDLRDSKRLIYAKSFVIYRRELGEKMGG